MLYFLIAVFLIIGVLDFFRRNEFDQYLLAGRSQSSPMVAFSMMATVVGGSATMGMVSLTAKVGFPAFWWYLAGTLGLGLLSVTVARKVRELGVSTLADLAGELIGPQARTIVAVVIVTAWTGIVAAQFVAAGRIMERLTMLDFTGALVVASLVITFYAVLGGQSSIMKTDALQFFVMFGALLVAAGFMYKANPTALSQVDFTLVNDKFTFRDIVYHLLILGGSFFIGPDIFSRLFTARDGATAARGAITAAILFPLAGGIVLFLGLSSIGSGVEPGRILTHHVYDTIPSWAGAWLLGGLFCAVVSSADTCLVTAAGMIEHDILKGKRTNVMRLFVVILGVASLGIGLWHGDIIGLLLMGISVFTTGIVAPVAVALFNHGKRPVRSTGLVLAIIVGGAVGLVAAKMGDRNISLLAFGLSAAISIASVKYGCAVRTDPVKAATGQS